MQLTGLAARQGIRLAGSVVGCALGGHLGLLVGSWAGEAAGKLLESSVVKAVDLSAEGLLDALQREPGSLEALYREALLTTLSLTHEAIKFTTWDDWFGHWDLALKSASTQLDANLRAQVDSDESILRIVLEQLDAQGAAMQTKSQSLRLDLRTIPDNLMATLVAEVPGRFREVFEALIVSDKWARAWKSETSAALQRIESQGKKTLDNTEEILTLLRANAAAQGQKADKADLDRALEEVARLKVDLEAAKAAGEAGAAEIHQAFGAGDFARFAELKRKQIDQRQQEAGKLPRDYFELGRGYEFQFDWPQALQAYREARRLRPSDLQFTESLAYAAQKQNQHEEAIAAYQTVLEQTAKPEDRARLLNNLGVLYSDTQRLGEGERAYGEALEIRRELARGNRSAYLPDVAMTLNNLGLLYSATQRLEEGEAGTAEAVAILLPFWQANPGPHGDQLARICGLRAEVLEALGRPAAECCELARQGEVAAYEASLKQALLYLVQRFCGSAEVVGE